MQKLHYLLMEIKWKTCSNNQHNDTHSLKTEQSWLRVLPLKKYRLKPQSLQHPVFFLCEPTPTLNDLLTLIKHCQPKEDFSPLIIRCDTRHDLQVFFQTIKIPPITARLTVLQSLFHDSQTFFSPPPNLPSKDSKTAQIK